MRQVGQQLNNIFPFLSLNLVIKASIDASSLKLSNSNGIFMMLIIILSR